MFFYFLFGIVCDFLMEVGGGGRSTLDTITLWVNNESLVAHSEKVKPKMIF